jgi:hypothetical protein
MNLSDLVAGALAPLLPPASTGGHGPKADAFVEAASRPVLQLSAMPTPINRAAYADPMSSGNPTGSIASLAAFRDLVDPVPAFSQLYSPGPASTEANWTAFVNGAAVRDGSSFAQAALAAAQQKNAALQMASLTPGMNPWLPVYASPSDWFAAADAAFTPVTIDLTAMGSMTGPYATAGGPIIDAPPPAWVTAQGSVPLDPATRLKSLTLRALLVSLNRPWLNPALLAMADVYLGGQPAGFYSTGNILRNDGVLPLLTTGFYLASDVRLEADWAPADRAMLARAADAGSPLGFESFALSDDVGGLSLEEMPATTTTATSTLYQIVAWTSSLVPQCPQTAG